MQNLIALNSKETKRILESLKESYSFENKLEYIFFINKKTNKFFIINRDFEKVDVKKLRINSLGMYVGEIQDDRIRLSIEGSQLIGPYSTKNIIELSETDTRRWLKGEDIEYSGSTKGFVMLKHNDDFLGCAKHKNDKLFNHVPKERRIHAKD